MRPGDGITFAIDLGYSGLTPSMSISVDGGAPVTPAGSVTALSGTLYTVALVGADTAGCVGNIEVVISPGSGLPIITERILMTPTLAQIQAAGMTLAANQDVRNVTGTIPIDLDTSSIAEAVWQYYVGDPADHASTLLATMHDWLFSLMGDGWQNADTVHAVKALADAIKLKTDQLAFADGKIVTDGTVDVDAIAQAVAAVVPNADPATIASAVVSALGPDPNITVVYRAPLTETATLQLIRGDDYFAAAGRDIRLTNYTLLDVHLADDAVSLLLDGTSYVGAATAGEGDKVVLSWELTAEQTALISAGLHTADIVADGKTWGHRVIGRIEVSVAER